MTRQVWPLGVWLLALGSACVDAPEMSSPTSAGPPRPGGPTSLGPSPTTGSTGETTTGGPGTTGATDAESSTTATGSTAPAEMCGDGIVGPGEECDLGTWNADTGACTLGCKIAFCGDGLVQATVEQCDLGSDNADTYGGCRPGDCQWAARCGDGVLDWPQETCDRGELNGSGKTPDDYAPCSLTCGFSGRLIFITSELFNGDLEGVSGADLKCRAAALAAKLPNPTAFRAWLSDDAQSPESRFDQWDLAGVPLILISGLIVADDLLDLADHGPRVGIAITEHGQGAFDWLVWTNTTAFGEVYSVTQHCAAWDSTDGAQFARQGRNAVAGGNEAEWQIWRDERWWTTYASKPCNKFASLYCIADGFEPEE